eukprot:m.269418 g.269418  ORF g.269418 m.269418 type:complete len:566 (-) comp83983_c0_seq1:251-1948(-)
MVVFALDCLVSRWHFCVVFALASSTFEPVASCSTDEVTCVKPTNEKWLVEGVVGASNSFVMFRGIPFAKAPVKELRWENPVSFEGIDGEVIDTKAFKPNCMQALPAWATMNQSVSEDCLFLNIWSPLSEQEDIKALLPVCLYIHGGGYAYGGANDAEVDGAGFAEVADCVAVTIQYRLGVFGFLGSNTFRSKQDNSTGNWGIQDQRMALKWVYDNIEAFHGDKNRIMIFGESAGAGGVSNHVAMKRSWPYFRNAAMQSGGFQMWVAKTLENAGKNFLFFVQKMNCESADPLKIKSCLQNASTKELVEMSTDFTYPHEDSWTACRWAPTIDGVELDSHPMILLETGKTHPNASIILGTNSDEGTDFIGYNKSGSLEPPLKKSLTQAQFDSWCDSEIAKDSANALSALYPVPAQFETYYEAAKKIVTDWMMTCPNHKFSQWHSQFRPGNTFVYLFDEQPGTIPTPQGVFHGAEVRFVFFDARYLIGWDEKILSLQMLRYWSNLAASDDVNDRGGGGRSNTALHWPTFTSSLRGTIHFTADGSSIQTDYRQVQCDYFNSHEFFQSAIV